MARRGFNRNQKRDRRGRWTKGAGGTTPERRRVRNAAAAGATIGFFATLGNPLAAIAGAGIGGGLAARNNRKSRK